MECDGREETKNTTTVRSGVFWRVRFRLRVLMADKGLAPTDTTIVYTAIAIAQARNRWVWIGLVWFITNDYGPFYSGSLSPCVLSIGAALGAGAFAAFAAGFFSVL